MPALHDGGPPSRLQRKVPDTRTFRSIARPFSRVYLCFTSVTRVHVDNLEVMHRLLPFGQRLNLDIYLASTFLCFHNTSHHLCPLFGAAELLCYLKANYRLPC